MERRRVVITGAAGMLGSAVVDLAPPQYEAIGVDLPDGDISVQSEAMGAIVPHGPVAVIHCAAYTDVDGCTRDPETAHRVNAGGTRNVALACAECDCHLIALSTDYVFDGEKGAAYDEDDAPNPINPYGESKLAGERYALEAHDRVLIARTQWLYGPKGKNFPHTIVTKGRKLGSLNVVADEYGSPTYTRDLASRLWELVERRLTGILHCVNTGTCTWAEFARCVLEAAGAGHVTVQDISRTEWESPTRRPEYSVMVTRREAELGLTPMRKWDDAAREYAKQYLSDD